MADPGGDFQHRSWSTPPDGGYNKGERDPCNHTETRIVKRLLALGFGLAALGVLVVVLLPYARRGQDEPPPRAPDPGPSGPPPLPSGVRQWVSVGGLPKNIAVFETVFWDPRDTISLRRLIRETPLVRDRTVLEIGTGSGLLSLCCLMAGARHVVATDVTSRAVANARYNAELLGVADRLEVRHVSLSDPGAYAVLRPGERFDLILSNPPWEDKTPRKIDDFAFYDEEFALLRSILAGLKDRLNPGGRALLAYGHVSAVRTLRRLAHEYGLTVRVLDDRDLDELPADFLPGMLLEVTPHS
jgi:predicted RNA methylase